MKQKEKRLKQKKRILDAARQKFFTKGYEKTTVREILQELDMNIGSLYNFYKNKEEILLELTSQVFDNAAQTAEELADYKKDPLECLLVEIAIYLYAVNITPILASNYIAAYKSYPISKMIVDKLVKRFEKMLAGFDIDYTYEDYYLRIMALKGALQSSLEEKVLGSYNVAFQDLFVIMFHLALPVFGISQDDAEKAIAKALLITETDEFTSKVNNLFIVPK